MIRPCRVRAHVRRTHPPAYVDKHLSLIADVREQKRERDEAALCHMGEMLARCLEEGIAAFGDD